ncbi:MAG: hypothetical protein P9F19_15830 [Candidatus Contendobacter sp.]|nr:hypothetical protein [Candidatus Contendobacter sp.]MDG4558841.1 hypothetical protein [Candidatus Contendobacter sp.]
MAWSKEIRLRNYHSAPKESGIYEVGFVRNNIFNPVYVGKAVRLTIFARLQSHYEGRGNKNIKDYLITRKRDNLWCHWMRVTDPSYMESNLLNRFGIRDDGLYKFNDRLEYY